MRNEPVVNEAEIGKRIQAGSQDPDDFLDLASALWLQYRHEEALSVLRDAPTDSLATVEKVRIWLRYGGYLRDVFGPIREAALWAERSLLLLQTEPDSLEIAAWRGCSRAWYATILAETDSVAAEREATQALKDLERVASESSPGDILEMVLWDASRMYLLLENFQQCIEYAERYLQLELDTHARVAGLSNLALAYSFSGRFQEAERILLEATEQASSEDLGFPSILSQLGAVQLGLGHFSDAHTTLRRAISAFCRHPRIAIVRELLADAQLYLLEVLHELKEDKEVAEEYVKVRECIDTIHDSRKSDALLRLGGLKQKDKSFEEARKLFTEVIQLPNALDSQRTEAQGSLLYCDAIERFEYQEPEEARALFLKLLALDSTENHFRNEILIWLAACNLELSAFAAAKDNYQEVMQSPNVTAADKSLARTGLAYAQGQILYGKGRYEEARSEFQVFVASRSEHDQYYIDGVMMLAHCSYALGDYTAARKFYQQVLAAPEAAMIQKSTARDGLKHIPSLLTRCLRALRFRK